MRRTLASLALLALASAACGRNSPPAAFPIDLLRAQAAGAAPRIGQITAAGEVRAALLSNARFPVRLPARPLLTFALGVDWAGQAEAPGWCEFEVHGNGQLLERRRINPRALRGFRDVSLELKPSLTELEFRLRFTDREGRDQPRPAELLMAVTEPTLHDQDAYSRTRGVVLISVDTLRRDHVGLYGYGRPTTPRIDALGARALVLDDAVSTSSWTLPAHLSMLTSADPGRHGGLGMHTAFNHKLPTLPALLRAKGYATHAVTSHLYVSNVYGLDDGFDRLDFHQDRKADDVSARAQDWLDRAGDRPFFLFLHFYDPHWHYDPPADRLALFEQGYTGRLSGLWQDFKSLDRSKLAPGDLEHLLALYDGEIRYTDDHLGLLFDHLQRRGLDQNTLLLLTSDHGEEFLDHGSWEHQKTLYDEVVRVPLLVAGPGIAARRDPRAASLLDVAPTILDWLGLEIPGHVQGRSLLRAADDREAYGETDQTLDGAHKLFLRAGQKRWKAIFTLAQDGQKLLGEEWYDLAVDPAERKNAPPRGEIADAVRQRALERWREGRGRFGRSPEVSLTESQREQLRALGYVQN